MIEFTVKPFAGRPGSDIAACTVNGIDYEMVNSNGAIHAVCRLLQHAGIPDQPWRANGGDLFGPSIYRMAATTLSETDAELRVRKFVPFPLSGKPQKGGSEVSDGESTP